MANLLDIRRRIRSVRNTRQITKAMQMVSAAKLRRAQERAIATRPFGQMITNVLKSLVARAETCLRLMAVGRSGPGGRSSRTFIQYFQDLSTSAGGINFFSPST